MRGGELGGQIQIYYFSVIADVLESRREQVTFFLFPDLLEFFFHA